MELIPHSIGIFFWITLIVAVFIDILAILRVMRYKLTGLIEKTIWLIIIIAIPIIGSILCLFVFNKTTPEK